jgi:hypothetical protein
MEHRIKALSTTGINMGNGKTALAYGRYQWTEDMVVPVVGAPIEDVPVESTTIINLSLFAKINANSAKHKEDMRKLAIENKRRRFKKEHPVRWVLGELVKKHLL